MNQNEINHLASLTTSRLSALAKPFTLNRSSSTSPKPSINSFYHCDNDDDPFSPLLDSFWKSNLSSKGHSVSLNGTVKTTALPDEGGSHGVSVFEGNPFLELPKNGDFDVLNWTQFGVGSSAGDVSMLQKVKPAVNGLNNHLTVSDGIFERSTGITAGKDILSKSEGTKQSADESCSFLKAQNKVAPLKIPCDKSSAKSTPRNQLSNILGDSDNDVDSPCWKGAKAFSLFPSEISQSVELHHVEKATEKHNTLNPRAPQFFPGIGYVTDDFLSSNSGVHVTTNLLSGEEILMNTVTGESLVELNTGELWYSTNINGIEKAFNMVNNPGSSSVDPMLNSHCTMTQSSKKDFATSKGKLVTIGDVNDSVNVKGAENPRANGSTMSGVFPTKGYSSRSHPSSSQVNVYTDLLKTFEGISKSLTESPKPDVKIMVGALHVLSELLALTCVDGVDSYGEHDPSMATIPQIINNLNDFHAKVGGEKISISSIDSTPAYSPFCLDSSLKLTKGLEMENVETLTVPHQLYMQSDYVGKNTVSNVFGQRELSSFASSSGGGTKKSNEIGQVIRRNLGKNLDFDKQMPPEASLFWNLWLDSEAERCYRKLKTYHWLMEAGVDVNCKDVVELWR